jgi:DNA polymerase-3 subunit chi
VADVLFYRLSETPVEATLPELLEKALARGWRVAVRVGTEAGLAFLDDRLWTWRDDSFLPHGVAAGADAARQPVLLTRGRETPNGAQVLMLVMGARAEPSEMAAFERVCVIFDGADAAAQEAARADWRAVTDAGLPAVYWAQEAGRWVRKASG